MHGGGKISMPPVVGVRIFSGTTQSNPWQPDHKIGELSAVLLSKLQRHRENTRPTQKNLAMNLIPSPPLQVLAQTRTISYLVTVDIELSLNVLNHSALKSSTLIYCIVSFHTR